MKSYRTVKRALRIRALTPCVAAMLIVPAAASARFDLNPQALVPQAGAVPHVSQLPSSFTTDGGSSYTFAPVSSPRGAPTVATIRHDGGSQTLAIVLAGLALGIALMAAGYSAFRVRPTLHTSVGRGV
jgi:hypothetical protein